MDFEKHCKRGINMLINAVSLIKNQNLPKISFSSNPTVNIPEKPDTFETSKVPPKEQALSIQELDKQIAQAKEDRKNYEGSITKEYSYEYYEKSHNFDEKIKDLVKKREKLIKTYNPNVAFLSDGSMTWSLRRSILARHPEIVPFQKLPKMEEFQSAWCNNKYFVMNKTNIGNMLDTSYELNKENYGRLSKDGLYSFSEIRKKYGLSEKEIYRYAQEGYFEPVKLRNIATGEEEPIHVLDINSETNKKGIERYQFMCSFVKESPYINKDYLPAKYLVNLGFGTEKELQKFTKTRKLTGKIMPLKTKDGEKEELCIFIKRAAEGELQFLRNENKNVMDVEQFAKRARMTQSEVEAAIVSGELQIIPHYIFESDKGKLFLHLKQSKNADFIDKKDFEYEMTQEEKNRLISARAKLAWKLAVNTRKISKEIVGANPELKAIFQKKDELEDYLDRKEKGELKEGEMEPHLTREEKIKIKMFYKAVWEKAGTEEYKQSFERAKRTIMEYKQSGFDGIKDEEAKENLVQIMSEKKE